MKIAVAIPTMNRPGMLREAIRSTLDQERKPDEIFVSDNSKERDSTLLADFPGAPLRYHHHDRLLPIEEHWTWAIRQPESDYVCWLEDDNLFRRDHFSRLAAAVEKFPQAALFGTAAVVFGEKESAIQRPVFAPVWKADLLSLASVEISSPPALATFLFGSPIASSSVMVNRRLMESEPLIPSGCRQPLDRWLWAQMAARGSTVYVPHQTMLYRVHGQQHSGKDHAARHRQESLRVSRLILELMKTRGIDPQVAVKAMIPLVDESSLKHLAYFVLRQRDAEMTRQFLPILLSTAPNRIPLLKSLGLLARFKVLPRLHLSLNEK